MNGELYNSDKRTVSKFVGKAGIASLSHNIDFTSSKEIYKCVHKCTSTIVEVIKLFWIVCGQKVGTRNQRVNTIF